MSSRSARRWTVRALLPLLLGGTALLAACRGGDVSQAAAPPAEPEALPVPVVGAAVADLVSSLAISGSLQPQSRVAVGTKLPGRLERVLVNIGDRVRAGQVVATLDAREIKAQADAARAAVNVAKASLDAADAALSNAALEHERAGNLFERGALPRQRLDAAETAHRSATAQRDLARAGLAQAEAAGRRAAEVLRDTTLRSPIDGVIVERNYDAGNLVNPGDKPVVSVADARTLKLEAGVGELDAGRLRVGMPARIEVQARPGVSVEGELAAIAPEIDPKNRQFQIQVRLSNPDGELLSGMYATARIEIARAEDAVTVPREAVSTVDAKRVVYRVADSRVQPVGVVEGLAGDGRVQIVSGLNGGDIVVADARRPMAPGTRVKAIK
jgi:HlyD family secretion protein